MTAGKYNKGDRANRAVLAGRLQRAMEAAWANTKRTPIRKIDFRNVPVKLAPRNHAGFRTKDYEAKLQPGVNHWQQCLED